MPQASADGSRARLRRFLGDVNRDPFLREEFDADRAAVLARYNLPPDAHAALMSGDQREVWQALFGGAVPARPWNATQLAMSGIQLWVSPSFLSPEECARLREEMSEAPLEKARVLGEAGPVHDPAVWLAKVAEVSADTMFDIARRINEVAPAIAAAFSVELSACEQPMFTVYRRGGHMAPHRDTPEGSVLGGPGADRQITAIVFVDDGAFTGATKKTASGSGHNPSGGSVAVIRGDPLEDAHHDRWDIAPREGALIAFRSTQWYEIKRVTRGRLHLISAWLLGPTV